MRRIRKSVDRAPAKCLLRLRPQVGLIDGLIFPRFDAAAKRSSSLATRRSLVKTWGIAAVLFVPKLPPIHLPQMAGRCYGCADSRQIAGRCGGKVRKSADGMLVEGVIMS